NDPSLLITFPTLRTKSKTDSIGENEGVFRSIFLHVLPWWLMVPVMVMASGGHWSRFYYGSEMPDGDKDSDTRGEE
ncbi:hypothetical protein U1Q18_005058, partial [Sarracenia purpurea var. burkii]